MPAAGKRYDDPNVNRQYITNPAPTVAGTGTYGYDWSPQPRRLKGFGALVRIAGTAAGAVLAAMIGTNTVAVHTLGTNTAGYTTHIAVASGSWTVAANAVVSTKVIGDATIVALPTYEFEIDKAATFNE